MAIFEGPTDSNIDATLHRTGYEWRRTLDVLPSLPIPPSSSACIKLSSPIWNRESSYISLTACLTRITLFRNPSEESNQVCRVTIVLNRIDPDIR